MHAPREKGGEFLSIDRYFNSVLKFSSIFHQISTLKNGLHDSLSVSLLDTQVRWPIGEKYYHFDTPGN